MSAICDNKIINLLVISDFLVEHFMDGELKKVFSKNNICLKNCFVQYHEFRESNWADYKEYDYVVLWFNLSVFAGNVRYDSNKENEIYHELEMFYNRLKEHFNIPIIWISFDTYEQDLSILYGNTINRYNVQNNLNQRILNILRSRDVLINLDKIIAKIGELHAYNIKYKYRWSCVYNPCVFSEISQEILKQYNILNSVTPKCVILDCDNVLWGGVLAEDGIMNIKLGETGSGRIYQDFQKLILQLYNNGIILAIASKNDYEDVKHVFDHHSGMILKSHHISCFKVNWENKAQNIIDIADFLQISLNSIVFIDDSINEIELVKELVPEVKTILFDKWLIFKNLNCFHFMRENNISTINKRNETYKTNLYREKLLSLSESYEDYLNSLEMKIDIRCADCSDYYRIAELSLRTNRRTNGSRYTVEKLMERTKDPLYRLYVINVSDKFCDLGIVGCIGVYGDCNDAELDLICLSCRALGRNIETIMLNEIDRNHKIRRVKIQHTLKNDEFLNLLKSRYGEESQV